jgi:hypothetical protein
MADLLLSIECTLNKFFLKRSLDAYRGGSGLRAEAWEFGEIERGVRILCVGAWSCRLLLLVFFLLRWWERVVVGVYVGPEPGGRRKEEERWRDGHQGRTSIMLLEAGAASRSPLYDRGGR